MKTPAGLECRFYYENFHRGREDQECRLIQGNRQSPPWHPSDCANCPVPAILEANNSSELVLEGTVKKGFLNLVGRKIEVRTWCSKHLIDVPNPYSGCPKCAAEKPGFRELFGED